MSSSNKPFPIIPAVVAVIVVALVVVFFLRGDKPAEVVEVPAPKVVAEAPRPTPVVSPTPSPTPAPTPEIEVRGPGESPNPTSIPPADPMAEFRIDPFAGRVILAGPSTPLPGATVTAYLFQEGNYRVAQGYPTVLAETTSDANGRFRFTPRALGAGEVLGWRATLEGHHTQLLLFPAGEGLGDRLRSTFQLKPSGLISGIVLDEQDMPIAGVTVGDMILGSYQRPGITGENMLPSGYTTSGEDGTFVLSALEAGASLQIPVRAEGFVEILSEAIPVGKTDVVFRLYKADAQLKGKVVDWNGAPARNVQMELRPVETRVVANAPPLRRTATDGNGSFQFDGMVSGLYMLNATLDLPETLGPGCSVVMDVPVLPMDTKELVITLPGPVRIAGRFVDAESKKGVAGVRLMRLIDEAMARERAFNVTSDDGGNFAFTAFVPGDQQGYEVRVMTDWAGEWFPLAVGEQPENVRTEQEHVSFMNARPGENRTGIDILVERGASISGIVIEPDGSTPVPDTPVFMRSRTYFNTISTDAEGKFTATVPVGMSLKLESKSELGVGALRIDTQKENPYQRLVLEAYATLEGDLVNSEGDPIAEQMITLKRVRSEENYSEVLPSEEKAITQGDGTWKMEQVVPGPIGVLPEIPYNLGYAQPKPLDIVLVAGEQRTGVRLTLEEGDYIEGRVVDDSTDKPLKGVTIFTSLQEVAGSTDDDGRFKLEGVPYETALDTVTASLDGYGEEVRRNVSIYDGEILFRLKPRGAVELRVSDAAGVAITSYKLRVLAVEQAGPGRGNTVWRETIVNEAGGVYKLNGLSPGSWRAEVLELLQGGREGRTGAEDFVVNTSGTIPQVVTVRLDAELNLTGTVVRTGDGPVAGAQVELLNPPVNLIKGPVGPGGGGYTVQADGNGRFFISPVAPGTYRLKANHEGNSSEVLTVQLTATTEPVELVLAPMPRVYGTLTAPDGSPVRRASIFILNENGVPAGNPLPASDGRYEVMVPSAGNWQLVFNQDDTANVMTKSVTLAAGASQELNVDFSKRIKLFGRITSNGAAASGNISVLLRGADGEEALAIPGSNGAYEVELSPGVYTTWYSSGQMIAPTGGTVDVRQDPPRQEASIALQVGSLDLLVVTKPGQTASGSLNIDASVPGAAPTTILRNFMVDRPNMRFLQVPAGSYQGTLSKDGEAVSTSGWTEVRAGATATMTVDIP